MSCLRTQNLRLGILFVYLGWGDRCGRTKKEVFFTIYTKNPLLLECSLQTLLRCAPEASASITHCIRMFQKLHAQFRGLGCTKFVQKNACAKFYIWHFSPKWHDALSTTWVDGGFLFRVQRCWASGQVTVRSRFANSEKQHEWLVKHYCHISIYGL